MTPLSFRLPRLSLGSLPLNLFVVAKVLGIFLFLFSLTMFLPLLAGILHEGNRAKEALGLSNPSLGFGISALVCGVVGFAFYSLGKRHPG
ncbi:MAG: hypothetical protein ACE5F1_18720, partial [Planctomycetota bacterium]